MGDVTTRAKVTVELVIEVNSRWGDDCPMKQVRQQAMEEAINKVGKVVGEARGFKSLRTVGHEIIVTESPL